MAEEHDKPELRTLPEGRYRSLEYLGGGGMGTVYIATDGEMNRRVALKIARPERTLDEPDDPLGAQPPEDSKAARTLAARFLQEAWVTGNLEHPGIPPVYEIGLTPGGTTYYTMRLIKGDRTLDDAMRGAKTIEDRIGLLDVFLKVCDTIAFAHAGGVIHRDLKPANVALGEFGEVVVIDWGISRSGGEESGDLWQEKIAELRVSGELHTADSALGTPGYMPPEAVLGLSDRMDGRSDVFSLGAILFRILTGRLPYRYDSYEEYVRQIVSERVPSPRSVDADVPEGLSRICSKALAKSPKNRYDGAADLAKAIRAWQAETARDREIDALLSEARSAIAGTEGLAGDPLLAQVDRVTSLTARVLHLSPDHPDAVELRESGAAIRSRGISERERAARKRLLGRTAVVLIVLVAIAAVVVAGRLDKARRVAVRERERAEDLAQFMLFDFRRALKPLGRLDLLVPVAMRTKEYYDDLPAGTLDDSASRRKAIALARVAEVLRAAGDLTSAEEASEGALGAFEQIAAAKPESADRRHDLALAHVKLGEIKLRRGAGDAAMESFAKAQEILTRLIDEAPGEIAYRKDLAYSRNRVGDVHVDRGRHAEAVEQFELALRARRELVAAHPNDEALLRDLSSSLGRAARYRNGSEAEALEDEALAIHRRLLELAPEDATRRIAYADAVSEEGDALLDADRGDAALLRYSEARRILRELTTRDPQNTSWLRRLGTVEGRRSDACRALGRLDDALEHAQAGLQIREDLAKQDPTNSRWRRDLASSRYRVGRLLTLLGDTAAALESHRAGLDLLGGLTILDPRNVRWLRDYGRAAVRTADLLAASARRTEAISVLDEAIGQLRRSGSDALAEEAAKLEERRDELTE